MRVIPRLVSRVYFRAYMQQFNNWFIVLYMMTLKYFLFQKQYFY